MRRFYIFSILFFGLIFLISCGGRKTKVSVPSKSTGNLQVENVEKPVLNFYASKEEVNAGEKVTLYWNSNYADEVIIENVGKFGPNGSIEVKPEVTTEYKAIAQGKGGIDTKTITIRVIQSAGNITEENLSVEEIFKNEIKDVFFDFDKYNLRPDAVETLKKDAYVLIHKLPNVKIIIEGHCDERGSEEYNLALGDKRANAVKEFLIKEGVDPSRIRTISYGEERPFALGHNEKAWALNRRAHFVLVKEDNR